MRTILKYVVLFSCLGHSASFGLIWPTPNPAFQNGEPIEAYVQPTVSGKVHSGLFGCVRNGGARFHEGLDLFPINRDSQGEALDSVYAVLPGRVAHVSAVAGHSSYGRYVVIEHDREWPAFHTLYAHLASIGEGVKVGARVEQGAILGRMGRSATYTIPKERAHVHFEMGFRLSDDFEAYYKRRKLGSPNRHGNWNGMNLVSIDPLEFYRAMRQGQVSNFNEHLSSLPAVARIRVFTSKIPDFVKNYPALLTRDYTGKDVQAWDIAFTRYGVPKAWTPRFVDEALEGRTGEIKVIAYAPSALESQSCRAVIDMRKKVPVISSGTIATLKKLFGFK